MKIFSIFVDGSNLMGSLSKMGLSIDNYQKFFYFIFEESLKVWESCLREKSAPISAQLQRTHWYALGAVDILNTGDARFKELMHERFNQNADLQRKYKAIIGLQSQGAQKTSSEIHEEAWKMCFSESVDWYKKQKEAIEGYKRFYDSLRKNVDFIDISACGHWKINFLEQHNTEKGLDTQLAIDMVMMSSFYDVALVVSGDADFIPSFSHIKKMGKQVGVVEFIKGHPPEERGRQSSSRLKAASDFVVQIYETDLERVGLASRDRSGSSFTI